MSNLSFQNPNNKIQGQELKDAFVKKIEEYKEQEKLIKGSYWQESKQKGCAVGCSEYALCQILGDNFEDRKHEYLSEKLDIPESIFYLPDTIFEYLENDSDEFVVDFVKALPVGKDLTNVEYKVKIWILEKTRPNANQETQIIIDNIIELHKRKIKGEDVDYSAAISAADSAELAELAAWSAAWSAADSAADSAAWSARSAADSAAWSARSAADSAAWSAESAADSAAWSARSAADSAARSAESAAWSAADSAELAFWQELSDFLIECLKEV